MTKGRPRNAAQHSESGRSLRRRFLSRAAAAAAGTVAIKSFPAFAAPAPAPAVLRFQGAWSSKDIFHEYALDFASKVRDMTGGELRIEVLPAGAVVPASGLLDAVSKGALDGSHGTLGHRHTRQSALSLWGSGPAFGMDANMLLAWHKYGGGKALLDKIYSALGANVVSYLCGPMPTQPLGWFQKPIARPEALKGLRFATRAPSADIYAALGATVQPLPDDEIVQALSSGRVDGAASGNASSDRTLGLPQAAKVCMLQSYHQNAEQVEILFNKPKYDALPPRIQAIIANAVEAASSDMGWKAVDRYSRDYAEMRHKDGVRFYKTPASILERQLSAYDAAVARTAIENPLFREVAESQRRFAERAVRWDLDTNVDRRMAYQHYFVRKASARKP